MSNTISFVGTIGRDAEVKQLPSGSAILNVNVACNTGFGDKKTTTWYRVALFGKRADGSLAQYLVKGQQIFVSGELTVRDYVNKENEAKYSLEVTANIIDLVGRKSSAMDSQAQSNGTQARTQAPQAKSSEPLFDAGIPF